jgi:tetratricopeptide (TPR) repeat protein
MGRKLTAYVYLSILQPGGQPVQLEMERFDPARVYYDRGLHYLRQQAETMRGLDDAIQMFHRALEKNRTLAVAWAYLGEAYWTRFRRTREDSSRKQAEEAVEEALRLKPGLPDALNARGMGLIIVGQFTEARAVLEEAVRAKPDFDIAWANLGEACQQLDDYSAGLEALQNAIRLQPGRSRHHLMLGLFYDHFAEHDAAVRAYEKALEMAPDSIMGLNNLGSTLLILRRYEDAASAFQRSLELEERAAPRSNLGTACFFQGKYEEAVENYRRATELEPSRPDHWGNLGDGLQALGRATEARRAYAEAAVRARERLAATPLSPQEHMDVGYYCAKARQAECALAEGARAAELQPGNMSILFRNSVIQCILGRHEEALNWLEKAVRLGLTRAEIENEPDLSSLRRHPRYQKLVELAE